MEKTVLFRDFEERDIDFIYQCKNDKELNSLIVNPKPSFTYEEAAKWVHGCMGEHETFKFWAICTNDNEKRIVGWVSISDIDNVNKSVSYHGIVIGDKSYKNSLAWIETYQFILSYAFNALNMNRLKDTCLAINRSTMTISKAMFFTQEGIERQSVYQNGCYYDKAVFSILYSEYKNHCENGEYDMKAIMQRLKSIIRNK